ncbi:hypothetical protein TNIN_66551 [Trichonephila inaurata madagascariensis]|uniref:Uncharacterized protein n=1 Tax=Trichonephila inaurata madagascariensis TaxID=2747483 RepID=A0A8X6J6U5_9ARAC|nr:hypothetical protein TNIN_66551 [Trichonephila inaurata madagascariensis]
MNSYSKAETEFINPACLYPPSNARRKRLVRSRTVYKMRGVYDLSTAAQSAYRERNNFDLIQMVSWAANVRWLGGIQRPLYAMGYCANSG